MATTFSNKVAILSEINTEYRGNSVLDDFFRYNDLGLPFATEVYLGKDATPEMIESIEESFSSLLELANVSDTGFKNVSEVFA